MNGLEIESIGRNGFLETSSFVVPERYRQCASFLRSKGHAFFIGSRLSHNFSQQFAVFRRAVQEVPLQVEERRIYQPWAELNKESAVKLGQESPPINNELVAFLRETEDPATMIINTLEQIRLTEYPDVARETALITAAFRSYDLFLSSVHGPRLNEILHS